MKKNSLLILFALIFCISVFSQKKNEKPNFSGNWQFDIKSSGRVFRGREEGKYENRSKTFNCPTQLFIEHNDPEIKMKTVKVCEQKDKTGKSIKTIEYLTTYFTDGRGETNTPDKDLVESKTVWEENKIFVTVYTPGTSGKNKKIEFTKEFIISKDSNEINERLRSADKISDTNDSYVKRVFKRSK